MALDDFSVMCLFGTTSVYTPKASNGTASHLGAITGVRADALLSRDELADLHAREQVRALPRVEEEVEDRRDRCRNVEGALSPVGGPSLRVRGPPHRVLRQRPEAWKPGDSHALAHEVRLTACSLAHRRAESP